MWQLPRSGLVQCLLCRARHKRHTTAVHLLESGVELNVIRGWLGHVSLDTTNRYAEINIHMKEAAAKICGAPAAISVESHQKPIWHEDASLLNWLESL